jgi:hypothetical protein
VLLAALGERFRGQRGLGGGDVPRSPNEITPEWLTRVLCPEAPDARVIAVASRVGTVGTTTRQALEVTYSDVGSAAGLPRSVFVKCTATVAQRLMLGLGGMVEGEPSFYNHVRPQLEIEAPAGYFAAIDPRSWRSVVVIEDVVATRGASFWTPARRIDRTQIEQLLGNVASWHGRLWDSPQLSSWEWLKTPAEQMRVIDALIGIADRTGAGTERAREVIPPALRQRRGDLYEGMRRSMRLAGEGAHTYLHGDLHIANTYLTQTGNIGVVDWQTGLKGSWAHDYAYILATASQVEDRRAWEHELLDLYLERLAAAGGERIPRAKAWQAYRQATLYPYFAWVYTIGRSRLQPRFQPDEVSLTMIRRLAAAIEDLDSLGAVGL